MDDYLDRQLDLLLNFVLSYRNGDLNLNSLIHRIEGISQILENESWSDDIFPIVLSMEQINAAALEAKRGLTDIDKMSVEKSLIDLESLIKRFRAK